MAMATAPPMVYIGCRITLPYCQQGLQDTFSPVHAGIACPNGNDQYIGVGGAGKVTHLFNSDLHRHLIEDTNFSFWPTWVGRVMRYENFVIFRIISVLSFESDQALKSEPVVDTHKFFFRTSARAAMSGKSTRLTD